MRFRKTVFTSIILAAALFVLTSNRGFAQAGTAAAVANGVVTPPPFEGVMTCSMSNPLMDDEKHDMIFSVKGDKLAIDIDAGMQGKVRVIQNKTAQKSYLLNLTMKQGYSMPYKDESAAPATDKDDIDLKPSGKKEMINGHNAEEYVANLKAEGEIHLWMASDFSPEAKTAFLHAMKSASTKPSKSQNQVFEKMRANGMIFVRQVSMKDGKEAMSFDLLKIENKSVDDALFAVPADITVQPMPTGAGVAH